MPIMLKDPHNYEYLYDPNYIISRQFALDTQNLIQSASARAQYLSARPPSMSSTISPMAGLRNPPLIMRNYFDTFVERKYYLSSTSPMGTVQNHYLSRNERRWYGHRLRYGAWKYKKPRKKHRHPYTFRRKKRHQ